MPDKIGSDVLGQSGLPCQRGGLGTEQRKEMLKKMQEQKRKKAMGDRTDLEGKEIKGEIPSDQRKPEVRNGSHGIESEKPIVVKSHRRGRPRKENKAEKLPESFFE